MKRISLAGCLVAGIVCAMLAAQLAGRVQGQAPLDLRVMTYNLKGD